MNTSYGVVEAALLSDLFFFQCDRQPGRRGDYGYLPMCDADEPGSLPEENLRLVVFA